MNARREERRHCQDEEGGFPGGTVERNLPGNAEDMGSIPGLGRSYMPQSNKAYAPQLLIQCSRAHVLKQEKLQQ